MAIFNPKGIDWSLPTATNDSLEEFVSANYESLLQDFITVLALAADPSSYRANINVSAIGFGNPVKITEINDSASTELNTLTDLKNKLYQPSNAAVTLNPLSHIPSQTLYTNLFKFFVEGEDTPNFLGGKIVLKDKDNFDGFRAPDNDLKAWIAEGALMFSFWCYRELFLSSLQELLKSSPDNTYEVSYENSAHIDQLSKLFHKKVVSNLLSLEGKKHSQIDEAIKQYDFLYDQDKNEPKPLLLTAYSFEKNKDSFKNVLTSEICKNILFPDFSVVQVDEILKSEIDHELYQNRMLRTHFRIFVQVLKQQFLYEQILQLYRSVFINFYKRLSPEIDFEVISRGDGGPTKGILNIENAGLIFFNYSLRKGTNAIVTRQKTIDLTQYKRPDLTQFHLNLLGIDPGFNNQLSISRKGSSQPLILGINTLTSGIQFQSNNNINQYSSQNNGIITWNTAPSRTVGTLDTNQMNFRVNNPRLTGKEIGLQLSINNQVDEVFILICKLLFPLELKFEFRSNEFFDDNKFITSPSLIDTDQHHLDNLVAFLDDKIDEININFDLVGYNIGVPISGITYTTVGSIVKQDTDQRERVDRSNQNMSDYDQRRYSYSSILVNGNKLTIRTESYVSPQTAMLHNTLNNSVRSLIDQFTPDYNPYETLIPTFRVYNPVLSALRSFGFTEAILQKILNTVDNSTIDPITKDKIRNKFTDSFLGSMSVIEVNYSHPDSDGKNGGVNYLDALSHDQYNTLKNNID